MKKSFLILAFAVIFAGVGFAQDFESMPKNTVTVDIGPTLLSIGWQQLMNSATSGTGAKTSSFGIGAQYERQFSEKVSFGGRFAYLKFGIGQDDFNLAVSSFSIEGHVRYYPGASVFFVDGMLGYANMAIGISGSGDVEKADGRTVEEKMNYNIPRDYLKLGVKLGWRVDFGNPGGFVFEPALGWSLGVGLGDTLGTKLSKKIDGDATSLDVLFWYAEQFLFVGGPRLSLSFGWRF